MVYKMEGHESKWTVLGQRGQLRVTVIHMNGNWKFQFETLAVFGQETRQFSDMFSDNKL